MPIPVIVQPASPRIIAQGVPFSLALSASNSPEEWAASGLPSGLSLDVETGVVSGTPLMDVATAATFTATNGDGTSAPVTVNFVVMSRPPGAGGPFDLLLDYEAGDGSNAVSVPGVPAPAEGAPLFWAPQGTNRYLLVGIKQFGVLTDLNPDSETVEIRLALKELEPERVLELTMGPTAKVGGMPDDLQRYRIPFRITPGNWASPLADNETDRRTVILALAELQVLVGAAAALHDDELTDSGISLQGGLSSPTTGDHAFTGLPAFASATRMRLTLTLSVAARPLQTVELVREFDLVLTGGIYVVSDASGPTTGQGAAEGGQWRATLALTGLTGDADGVEADYALTTTNDETTNKFVWNLSIGNSGGDLTDPGSEINLTTSYRLSLWDGDSFQIGTTQDLPTTHLSPGVFFAALQDAWAAAGGTGLLAIVATSDTAVRIEAAASTAVRGIGWSDMDPPGSTTSPTSSPSVAGTPRTASVKARLEQLEAPDDVPLNLTSNQFLIGVARDMVPDA